MGFGTEGKRLGVKGGPPSYPKRSPMRRQVNKQTKQLRVSVELHKKLRLEAAKKCVPMGEILVEVLEGTYLDSRNLKAKK